MVSGLVVLRWVSGLIVGFQAHRTGFSREDPRYKYIDSVDGLRFHGER